MVISKEEYCDNRSFHNDRARVPMRLAVDQGFLRLVSYRQLRLSQLLPVQSTLLYSPPKHKSGKAPAKTQFLWSSKTRSRSHSVVWEDICKSMEILNPALLSWASTLPWRKQHNAFRTTTHADLNAEGLNVQTVNDLLSMYVGCKPTCSPYELCA